MNITYNQALVEVEEVLNNLSMEDYDKIPVDIIQDIKDNKDTSYKWTYDIEKELIDQNLSTKATDMISHIISTYILDPSQKEYVKERIIEREKEEIELNKEKLQPLEKVFENNKKRHETETEALIQMKNEPNKSFFSKIKEKIINFFSHWGRR